MGKVEEIRAYKKRWEKVAEVERAEVERMTPAQKLADLSMLMAFARGRGDVDDKDDEAGIVLVRRRWNLLAERMGV